MPDGWEGWAQHHDKTGTPCAYCGEPSTRTLVVEPDEFLTNGSLKRRGKRVGLCASCQPAISGDSAEAVHFRRRRAKGHKQLELVPRESANKNALLK